MKERPILFSTEMVQAILKGDKTQTRRVVKSKFDIHELQRGPFLDDDSNGVARFGWDYFKGAPAENNVDQSYLEIKCPYGKPGDQLWVRESISGIQWDTRGDWNRAIVQYKSDMQTVSKSVCPVWMSTKNLGPRPSIHMPRWASRIQLEVTNVRVERVQDISEDDAFAEGVPWNVVNDDIANGIYLDRPMRKEWCPQCKGEGTYQGLGQNHGVIEVDCPECDTGKKIFRNIWDSINAERGYGWDVNPYVWIIEFRRIKP